MSTHEEWPAEMTAAEYRERIARAKTPKYGNRRTVVDGITFDSAAEARRYGELRLLERAGQVSGLRLQPEYLLPAGVKYRGDFEYTEAGRLVCEDVKGVETQAFRIKAKLFRERYPHIELRVTK